MSIELSLTVYGPQLATALMNDDEELAYFFNEMAGSADGEVVGADIAGLLPDPAAVVAFLRVLADAIEAANE